MSNKQSRRKAKVTFLVLLTLAIAISTLISSYYLKNRTSYSSQAAGQGMIINSFEQIPDIAKQRNYDEIFYIKIPKSIYIPWFIVAVHQYLFNTGNQMIGDPIGINFLGSNRIRGTFSYQLPSETARKIVEYQHYYYIDNQKAIKVRVTSANVSEGRTIPNLKNIIENTMNSVLNEAWTVYRQYVEPTFISNDANYLYLGLRVKTGIPIPVTPKPQTTYANLGIYPTSVAPGSKFDLSAIGSISCSENISDPPEVTDNGFTGCVRSGGFICSENQSCWWKWTCTASNTAGVYTATFTGANKNPFCTSRASFTIKSATAPTPEWTPSKPPEQMY